MTKAEPPDFLVHRAGDSVAVAVRDLSPGTVRGGYLSGDEQGGPMTVLLAEPVPLGHKFSLQEIAGVRIRQESGPGPAGGRARPASRWVRGSGGWRALQLA
jgi:hypothetical protein